MLWVFCAACAVISFDVYSGTITIKEDNFWGNSYYLDGQKIGGLFTREELRKIMKDNPQAIKELEDSTVIGMSSFLLIVSGAIMVTEQFVSAAEHDDPSMTIAFAGVGFTYLGVWLRDKTHEKYKKAIDLYNAGPGDTGRDAQPQQPRQTSMRNKLQYSVSPFYAAVSYRF